GFGEDLSDVAVGNLMTHEGAQLFELRVGLTGRGKSHAITFCAEGLGARLRAGRRGRGYGRGSRTFGRREGHRRARLAGLRDAAHRCGNRGPWLAIGEHLLDLVSAEMP